MEQRLSLITLGISDLERAIAFYRGLGWELHPGSVPGEVVFFQLDGMAFAIWSRAKLAADSAVTDGGGWGGVTLAHNVRSPEEVDATLTDAAAAGARVARAGAPTPWGGYSGVFIDPDGHPWEVEHNSAWPLDAAGLVTIGS